MGRPRNPTQNKVLQGNFRRDRDSHGPEVEIGLPPCPVDAPDYVRKVWEEQAPALVDKGLLATNDGPLFYAYMDTYAKFVLVSAAIVDFRQMVASTPNGYMQLSAAMIARSKLLKELVSTGREFGCTPAARSSMKAPQQGQLSLGAWDDV